MRRAGLRCEYCLIHEDDAVFTHEVDHIVSRQHGGEAIGENLAYACMVCNRFKGANLSSFLRQEYWFGYSIRGLKNGRSIFGLRAR